MEIAHLLRSGSKALVTIGLVLLPFVSTAQVSIDNEAGSSFNGTKRVAIAQFGIEYYTQLTLVGRSGGNTAVQVSNLSGVSDQAMQAMVDQLYAQTIEKLKSAGFEVVDQALVKADPGYQELVASYAKPSPMVINDSQGVLNGNHQSKVFAPTGMMAFFATGGSSGPLRGNMSDRINSQNYGIASREAEVAKRLNATLLKFSFLANYGMMQASKNGFLATYANAAAKVALETAAVLQPYDTQVQWVDASGARAFGNVRRSGATGAFYLDKPLKGAEAFTVVETTSAESKGSDNMVNAVFDLLGSKNAKKNQAIQVNSTDEAYTAAFTPILGAADDALISALKNGR
ncbi:SurA N-terminal domain-containing protein [Noviherbaspirillum galbum]|uniref:Uncharacterized protein n=1 Tax=Noviherbaspirillum galbum TaxID=2709383 RepID=A0A6B3SZ68_9BURK|nr:hypothetical protein [Noviherbaspirillum galbum]NEX63729.1 hypothetical protein [Noviherbaspirillum galbum]